MSYQRWRKIFVTVHLCGSALGVYGGQEGHVSNEHNTITITHSEKQT